MEEQAFNQKALFLPFMQIPTGHHHVADTLMEDLKQIYPTIHSRKVDILSYSYGKVENLVSGTYLKWIDKVPQSYDGLYRQLAVKNLSKRRRQLLYEWLFSPFFKRLLRDNEPSILFCTHALPSNLASILKKKRKLSAITVNVYTDYFVNRVWGMEEVDYHFAPTELVKDFLMNVGVEEERIFVTGIPVHPDLRSNKEEKNEKKGDYQVLVTGGSLGVGRLEQILSNIGHSKQIKYFVLCGKNAPLYERLVREQNPYITPIPYVTNKHKLNEIYNMVDAVITKPGGVTISECLMKQKPIFISHALPGQEKINEQELQKLGLIQSINLHNGSMEAELISFFTNETLRTPYERYVNAYHQSLEKQSITNILQTIMTKN